MNAYEVTVDTTNALASMFVDVDGNYHACTDGKVIVVTDTPTEIFAKWGGIVLSIKRLGVGEFMTSNPNVATQAVWTGTAPQDSTAGKPDVLENRATCKEGGA